MRRKKNNKIRYCRCLQATKYLKKPRDSYDRRSRRHRRRRKHSRRYRRRQFKLNCWTNLIWTYRSVKHRNWGKRFARFAVSYFLLITQMCSQWGSVPMFITLSALILGSRLALTVANFRFYVPNLSASCPFLYLICRSSWLPIRWKDAKNLSGKKCVRKTQTCLSVRLLTATTFSSRTKTKLIGSA